MQFAICLDEIGAGLDSYWVQKPAPVANDAEISDMLENTPAFNPAMAAAPQAVDSSILGRNTGTFKISA